MAENKVEEIRIREGLSQRELADLSDVSPKTIYRIEKGEDSVQDETKHKVVKGFNKVKDKLRQYAFEGVFSEDGV